MAVPRNRTHGVLVSMAAKVTRAPAVTARQTGQHHTSRAAQAVQGMSTSFLPLPRPAATRVNAAGPSRSGCTSGVICKVPSLTCLASWASCAASGRTYRSVLAIPRSPAGASEVSEHSRPSSRTRGRAASAVPCGGDQRAVEPSAYLTRPARVVVVDDLRRSEAAQAVGGGRGCGRGHLDADRRRELNGQGTGGSASVGDQEPLASAESQHLQGLHRGEAVDRQCPRQHGVQPARASCRVSRGDQGAFGPKAASAR
jgi:hypothetical protein